MIDKKGGLCQYLDKIMKRNLLVRVVGCLFFASAFLLAINFFLIFEAALLVSWQKKSFLVKDSWSFSPSFALSSQRALLSSGEKEKEFDYLRSTVIVHDARPLTVKNYLEYYHSPLAPFYQLIFDESLRAGINPYLVVAIGQQESNLCKKIPPNCFNCWGIGIHSRGTLCYESYEQGIIQAIKYLKEEYRDKGLDTPEEMMIKYCPLSNGSWAAGVNQFLEELNRGFGQ